jgi:hypothetical protein
MGRCRPGFSERRKFSICLQPHIPTCSRMAKVFPHLV